MKFLLSTLIDSSVAPQPPGRAPRQRCPGGEDSAPTAPPAWSSEVLADAPLARCTAREAMR
jgi:hypothetical protein